MNSFKPSPFKPLVTVFFCLNLLAACSGSSDSPTMTVAVAQGVEVNAALESSNAFANDGDTVASESTAEADAASELDRTMSDLSDADSGITLSVVSDPMIQNRTQVDFEITVPMYQSDALQIRLVWGDADIVANWVGDESWSVSADFPTETEHPLTVTFYDDNGDIELGRYEQLFRTGFDSAESLQITADQFDTEQFDKDGDGVSNLAELIAGNDPTVDDDSLLEIRDSYRVSDSNGISINRNIESLLSEQRPISSTTQEQVSSAVTLDIDIQIDLDGNGALTRDRRFSCEFDIISGIRTVVDNTVSWEASRSQNDCDFTLQGDLTNTITIVDETTRTYAEEVVGKRFGSFTNDWESSTTLTGHLVEGTTLCKAVAGTYSSRRTSRGSGNVVTVTSVTKEIDDRYWRVEQEVTDHNFHAGDEVVITLLETREHFVRDLHFGSSFSSENPELFICDFVDI